MTWSVIQSASASASASSVAATFTTANLSAGSKIIVAVGRNSRTGTPVVKDGALNTWTHIAQALNGATSTGVDLYALDVPAGDVGTKPTITANGLSAGNAGYGILIQEVPGLLAGNTTAMCDGTAGTKGGTTATTGSPTYSSTAVNEYLVAVYGDFGDGNTVGTTAGWTADAHNVNSGTDANVLVQYKNSTNGAESDGFTSADTGGWGVIMVAFQLAAATFTAAPPRLRGQAVNRSNTY